MSSHAPVNAPLGVEEYLQRELSAEARHEYVAGQIYAMTGGTLRHNTIALNIATRLRAAAAASCNVFINDVKVRAAHDVFYYPDVVVACGGLDDRDVALSTPCLVVEVTSPSSLRIDRYEKMLAYRQIPSLRAYLIIDQDQRSVEHYRRDSEGPWEHDVLTGSAVLALDCPHTSLSLDEMYERVALATADERLRLREDTAVYG